MKNHEERKLEKFNKEMGKKVKALKFSKKIDFDSSKIDEYFAALGKTEYLP